MWATLCGSPFFKPVWWFRSYASLANEAYQHLGQSEMAESFFRLDGRVAIIRRTRDYSHISGNVTRVAAPVNAKSASSEPQVTGSGADNGSSEGGGTSESGEGGGDDDPPIFIPPSGGNNPRRRKSLLKALALLLSWLIWPVLLLFSLVPDFVRAMRLFEDVFPYDIHRKRYMPDKTRLLRELCVYHGAEWDVPWLCRAWKGFWVRVRFAFLLFQCFRAWFAELLPKGKSDGGGSVAV
jgi:hypothetical protein